LIRFPKLDKFPKKRAYSAYAPQMAASIAALLRLFEDKVPDAESHACVLELAVNSDRWSAGHAVRDVIRDRLLAATDANDQVRCAQYGFEESCSETLYNEIQPDDPFDTVSPYWVVPNAIGLARLVGVPLEDVLEAMHPNSW
jgi:hypothetical protein